MLDKFNRISCSQHHHETLGYGILSLEHGILSVAALHGLLGMDGSSIQLYRWRSDRLVEPVPRPNRATDL